MRLFKQYEAEVEQLEKELDRGMTEGEFREEMAELDQSYDEEVREEAEQAAFSAKLGVDTRDTVTVEHMAPARPNAEVIRAFDERRRKLADR